MTLVPLRPILTLGAGIVIGLLIAWCVFGRNSIGSPNTPGVSVSPFPLVLPNKPAIQSTSPLRSQQDDWGRRVFGLTSGAFTGLANERLQSGEN
jgi:hypothetical protein